MWNGTQTKKYTITIFIAIICLILLYAHLERGASKVTGKASIYHDLYNLSLAHIDHAILERRYMALERVYGGEVDKNRNNDPGKLVILHIGPHKVASSYIQSKMCSDVDTLRGYGIKVPLPGGCQCKPKVFAGIPNWLMGNYAKAKCSKQPIVDLELSVKNTSTLVHLCRRVRFPGYKRY
jgi:hypothetical protein